LAAAFRVHPSIFRLCHKTRLAFTLDLHLSLALWVVLVYVFSALWRCFLFP
jgi:hypothetical protein